MGGYVTNSRLSYDVDMFPYRHRAANGTSWSNFLFNRQFQSSCAMPASQTTTSYRSRGNSDAISDFGRNWAAVAQRLRTEHFNRRTRYDNGHPFSTVKTDIVRAGDWISISQFANPLTGASFVGHFSPAVKVAATIAAVDPSKDYWGTRAVSLTLPGESPAALAQALIELYREGLPRLIGETTLRQRALTARNAGSEYLNAEFGWRPLVNDVRSLAGAVARSAQLINNYIERSGLTIRRQLEFDPVISLSSTVVAGASVTQPYGIPLTEWLKPWTSSTGTRTTIDDIRIERKYAGAYTYHVPPAFMSATLEGYVQRANYLYGLEFDPELLWNVAPWSWLADWMFNIGDVIHNAVALSSDGLVMRYGYLMTKTTSSRTVTLTGAKPRFGSCPSVLTAISRSTRKERHRASPYGFGLNPSSFTGRQWAILAALGLTNGSGSLRYND